MADDQQVSCRLDLADQNVRDGSVVARTLPLSAIGDSLGGSQMA